MQTKPNNKNYTSSKSQNQRATSKQNSVYLNPQKVIDVADVAET